MKIVSRLVATFLGIGYSPVAPGTMGALALVVLYWFVPPMTTFYLIVVTVAVTLLGVYCSTITEKDMQKKLGKEKGHDPGIIVIDEVAGMLIALIAVPKTMPFVVAAFILFRIFDIAKPFPVKQFEKLPFGWGIMFDDVMAGVYANFILQMARLVI